MSTQNRKVNGGVYHLIRFYVRMVEVVETVLSCENNVKLVFTNLS